MNQKMKSFELMQYFYRSVHEPLIHGFFHLSAHLDEQVLSNVVTLSASAVLLIFCTCTVRKGRPRWERKAFSGKNVVRVVPAGANGQIQAEALITSSIQIDSEPQLKIFLVRETSSDTLCIIMNHMVCDGTGFQEYLYLLSSLYTNLMSNKSYSAALQELPCGTGQLFGGFSMVEKSKILFSTYDLSAQKKQAVYRLQGDQNHPFIMTHRIGAEDLIQIKKDAKQHGTTINDMILCAYARTIAHQTGERHIVIPCPVDLRKYQPKAEHAICNLTSNYICSVDVNNHSSFYENLIHISEQMKQQKQSKACLKSVILLETAFHLLPFRLLQSIFPKVFTIPVLSYTNLGRLNSEKLIFSEVTVKDGYLTGAVKFVPYFQIAASTFGDEMTLSCNLYGTLQDQKQVSDFLAQIHCELISSGRP